MPTMPVKAAGWRIEPPVSLAVAARQRRAATAADGAARRAARRQQAALAPVGERGARLLAAPVRRQPGRGDRTVVGGLVRRAHGELVHVELAEHHRAVAPEIGGDGRLVGRLEAVEDVAAGLGMDAFGGVEVLDPDRQALERTAFAPGETRVARLGHGERLVGGDGDEGVERLAALDRGEMGLGDLDARDRPGFQPIARLGERQGGEVGQRRVLTREQRAARPFTRSLWGRERSRPRSGARWRAPLPRSRRRSRRPRASAAASA